MPTGCKKSKILIVENESIVARDIQQQLLELGYNPVGHATSGESSILLAEQLSPDLVLMDIQLGGSGMDGIAAAHIIRTQLSLPVVFLTAFAADDVLSRAKLTEPFGYILKPFSERELRTVVEMALYKSKTDNRLRDSVLHTQTILDNMADGLITISGHGIVESFNKAATVIFGYLPAEIVGKNVSQLMPQPQNSQHNNYLATYQATGKTRIIDQPCEVKGLRKDGTIFPMSLSVSRMSQVNPNGNIDTSTNNTFIGLVRDITQQRQDVEEIRRLAFYDALTGLPNRRLLIDRLSQAMLASARTGHHGALMFLDLDHFKQLNDTLGHDLGDLLLQQVANRLQACVREGDSVARLGGDEFVVLLEALSTHDIEAATQAKDIAAKILVALGHPYILREHNYTSTPSIGIVVFVEGNATVEDLLKKVDVAMYQAKAAGRNTARFFDPEMQAAAAAHSALEKDMRTGLKQNEFVLHYQIQVDDNANTTGVEALVRWQHCTRGMVSPGDFIPLAEETGLILPLGQWVLETACAQLVTWAAIPQCQHWTIAVNVSASQFAQASFVANVEHALAKTGANPALLKLELTESMLVKDVDGIIVKMNAIRQRGVAFSLDDFGTGYSSLTYLKRLPLTQLKIDQSFVRDVLTDPSDAVIARTILALGHSLGLKVIAEGVETLAQRDFLTHIGCDAFQGYFYGRPATAASLICPESP